MVSELETLIPEFSAVNHTHCFLHVNNLVGRSLVKQFDIPKKVAGSENDEKDDELLDLAGDMEYEDRMTREQLLEEAEEGDLSLDDNLDEWIDERAALSQAECDVLDKSTRPVKMVLVKVSILGATKICLPFTNRPLLDPQAGIQDHQLDDNSPSRMEKKHS